MKKIAKLAFSLLIFFGMNKQPSTVNSSNKSEDVAITASTTTLDLGIHAKAAYLMDSSGQMVMYAENEHTHLPIASMCKIMTLLLSFEAIDKGIVSMDEPVTISEKSASMGGSQVFLEVGASYPIRELIKSIVVCSANDSCVAMAEKICGSESLFVDKMNEKAKELGANDTLFSNCTGLPKEPQYSCAKDVAVMLRALLSHQEYFNFGKVWMDKFQHPKGRYTEITNTNKLIRFYDGCDGGKTGFTNEAGFCLAATAVRNNLRVISVAIGADTSQNRFSDVKTMFDYAFSNYEAVSIAEKGSPLDEPAKVNGGKQKSVIVTPQTSVYCIKKKGEEGDVTTKICYKKLTAPITTEEVVGELIVYKNGIEIQRVALLALEKIEKSNFFDRIHDIARNWNS